jgi:exodeoxyribonuclease V gamma subunit
VVHLYSADRAGPLAERLADVVSQDRGDPMTAEWLAVPTEGMRRWVTLELAKHLGATGPGTEDGVAANFVRALPGTLRSKVLAAADAGEPDPWQIDRMVWPLLEVFEEAERSGATPEFTRIARGASRVTRVRVLADLFDRYHLHRPDMVRDWAAGGAVDGASGPLAPHLAWQPLVWRQLRARIGRPSPPERIPDVLEAVRRGEISPDLPDRLLLFGFTTLPGRDFPALLTAVGARRSVHLFLLAPSRLTADMVAQNPFPNNGGGPRMRVDDTSASIVRQPLLRTWGRSSRETALLVADATTTGLPQPEWVDGTGRTDGDPTPLLGRLQGDIRGNRAASPGDVAPGDRSVQLHACFGPMREVEVARDAILHILADDPSIDEEDVLVVCPGLESFAPLVEAAFGPASPGAPAVDGGAPAGADGVEGPRLRYRIADRSIRTANPVLGALGSMLELVSGRFEVAPVLDFLASAPVRQRFGIDDDVLGIMVDWVARTRVRWGLDTVHRSGFALPESVTGNTWRSGLDRLLLGSVTTGDGLGLAIGDVAPLEVESGDAEWLGVLCTVVGRLAELAEWGASDRRPIGEWVRRIRDTGSALFAAPDQATWQTDALRLVLDQVLEASGTPADGSGPLLDLRDLRRLLEGKLGNEPGRPDFFRGGVTVTSMTPLRWVPFRVVCILGLDQEFIGAPAADAADLVASSPRVGDPDHRIEFRQSLLEAVLMAGDHLVIVRDGHDVRSNHAVPPVVAVAELVDAVVELARPDQRDALRSGLETRHPRHSFDETCLVDGAVVPGVVWGFDRADRHRALARRAAGHGVVTSVRPVIAGPATEVIELDSLRTFLVDPVAAFASMALQLTLPRDGDEDEVDLPVEPGALELAALGRRLLSARRSGASDDDWLRVERRIGTLPPGALESGVTTDLFAAVDALLDEAAGRGVGSGQPELFEVDIVLDDGTQLVGSVPLLLTGPASGPARMRYARPRPTFELVAWLDLMALVATEPGRQWRSVFLSRGKGDEGIAAVDLEIGDGDPDPGVTARHALDVAVRCYRAGMREPLPLFPTLSRAVAVGEPDPQAWRNRMGWGDGQKTATAFFFGTLGYHELMDLPALDSDPDGPGGRVERWARYLWGEVAQTTGAAG